MMRLKMSFVFLFVSAMFLVSFPSPAQASSQQETLDQYISDLQKNPGDNSFREKIIKLAQEMKPVPALPEEAQKHLDRGVAAIEGAKSEEDFKDSITEFTQVVNSAPWFGGGYRPLAIAQDKAGQYDAALKNLEFYLLSQPSAEDAAWAKSMMNKIGYRKEKAAKESSPERVAEKKQNSEAEFMKSLDRAKYTGQSRTFDGGIVWDNELTIIGTTLTRKKRMTHVDPGVIVEVPVGTWYEVAAMPIIGRKAEDHAPTMPSLITATFIISDDGNSITQTNGGNENFTFYRH